MAPLRGWTTWFTNFSILYSETPFNVGHVHTISTLMAKSSSLYPASILSEIPPKLFVGPSEHLASASRNGVGCKQLTVHSGLLM